MHTTTFIVGFRGRGLNCGNYVVLGSTAPLYNAESSGETDHVF